jgi:hypothetical protein
MNEETYLMQSFFRFVNKTYHLITTWCCDQMYDMNCIATTWNKTKKSLASRHNELILVKKKRAHLRLQVQLLGTIRKVAWQMPALTRAGCWIRSYEAAINQSIIFTRTLSFFSMNSLVPSFNKRERLTLTFISFKLTRSKTPKAPVIFPWNHEIARTSCTRELVAAWSAGSLLYCTWGLSVRNVVPTLTSSKRRGLSLNGRC